MNEHIVKSFEEELNQLAAEVVRMGGLAEAQVQEAIGAFSRRDVPLAQAIVGRDEKLDALEADIERSAIRLIALRQPMANDLRRAMAAMKIAMNLERCGDLAKNIAKRTQILAESDPAGPVTRSIERMGKLVAARLKEVLDAYTASEVDRAVAVWTRDTEVDEHYESLFRELLTYMMGDPRMITPGAHLLFVAKNLERIGDHATNIAEIVHYEITGREIVSERPKMDALTQ
ncbi:phosphate signaling complex protein PhoU [Caulobacter mirabilis]|uniref:Phosphate-specific transport system accessory protein PhoU n=1 Tax=Caulobacter mirabilis TaxID=69666 RepID=A0A2D2AUI4_9CAUL|nr:phosphate signaling complex protein PhoU [Caulobacter mirabilis]ATQ41666.1 phosphate transport system regulatory protein PhoU [Caulobacter mirabilis]